MQRIDHVELFVPDRFGAAEWYRDVLGLEIVERYRHGAEDPGRPLMISSDDGITQLALFTGIARGDRATAGFHLVAFAVDGPGFLSFVERLERLNLRDHHGERVTSGAVVDHGGAFSVYFSDPFGHGWRSRPTSMTPCGMRPPVTTVSVGIG